MPNEPYQTNETIDLWYIKDRFGVTSILTSSQDAEDALSRHRQYLQERRGPATMGSIIVPRADWEAELVTLSNIDGYTPARASLVPDEEELFEQVVSELLVLAPQLGTSGYDEISTREIGGGVTCIAIEMSCGATIYWGTADVVWAAQIVESEPSGGPDESLRTTVSSLSNDPKGIAAAIWKATDKWWLNRLADELRDAPEQLGDVVNAETLDQHEHSLDAFQAPTVGDRLIEHLTVAKLLRPGTGTANAVVRAIVDEERSVSGIIARLHTQGFLTENAIENGALATVIYLVLASEPGFIGSKGSRPDFNIKYYDRAIAQHDDFETELEESRQQAQNLTDRLVEFATAAQKLEGAWSLIDDDGNHPIVTLGLYPFGESFDEVERVIQIWAHGVKEGRVEEWTARGMNITLERTRESVINDRVAEKSETLIDIAMTAGMMVANGTLTVNDSRQLVADIATLAKEFDAKYEGTKWGEDLDYIETVDNFAQEQLPIKHGGSHE